jgi:two-component system, response regulator PdtaR
MQKIVIAEDNPFIVAMLREALTDVGYEVCGVASSARELLNLSEKHKPDIAVLDVRLADGSNGVDAAIELSRQRTVGILYVTGNPQQVLEPPAPVGTGCLRKPFTGRDLVEALGIVVQICETGKRPERVPRNLHIIRRTSLS